MEININLRCLMNRLAETKNKRVTVAEVARAAGCSRATLYRYVDNTIRHPRLSILEGIIQYFHSQGMEIGIDDLLTVSLVWPSK